MSTFTDGAPPSVAPGPEDGPVSPSEEETTGSRWLQDELKRRMAARASGAGGRHARRDTREELVDGSGYVPRHSVALPSAPAAPEPRRSPAPAPHRPGNTWTGPEHGSAASPADPPAGDEDETVSSEGGRAEPSEPYRPIPRAFRPAARRAAGDAPATFGGPGFSAPAGRAPAPHIGPEEPAVFGGPGFAESATRAVPRDEPAADDADCPQRGRGPRPQRPATSSPAAPSRGGSAAATSPAETSPAETSPAETSPAVAPSAAPSSAAASSARVSYPASAAAGPVDAAPSDVASSTAPPSARNGVRPPESAEIDPPRAAARLLAAPGPVADAAGTRPAPSPTRRRGGPARVDITDPLTVPGAPRESRPHDDEEFTVLWSASAPPTAEDATEQVVVPAPRAPELDPAAQGEPDDGPPTEIVPTSSRVKVILSERRNGALPVRTVVDIQEGGAVGELLRSNLIGSQLAVALRFAIGVGLTLGLLPLAFAAFPEIGRMEVLGLRLPWLLLGVLVYPFLLALGWWHTRTAERVEQNFADHVQE